MPAIPFPSRCALLHDRQIAYAIRPAPRARAPYLSIRPGTGLVAHLPPGHGPTQAQRLIDRHAWWVVRHLARWERLAAEMPKRWPYGSTLPYRGQEHEVHIQEAPRRMMVRQEPEGRLLAEVPRASIEQARRVLIDWYREQARWWCGQRADALAALTGVAYRRISVRDQRTRWGSCSARGSLNFNYRLVMAPPEILDYVILHELMHRRHLDHSRRFWRLVGQHCPAYQERIAWLRRYGPFLGVP